MQKVYCQECFAATEYSQTKPSFCSKCGKSLIGIAKANTPKPQPIPVKNKPSPIVLDENEENDLPVNVPTINKIEIEIDENLRGNRHTLGSIIGTKSEGDAKPLNASIINKGKKSKTLNKKQLESLWSESFPKTNRQNPSDVSEKE